MKALCLLLPLLASALISGCTVAPFSCSADDQCANAGRVGWCEENHRCSFEDLRCPSRRRYAPFAEDEACVAPRPACQIDGIASGANFSCAWSNGGGVACWGENNAGQLGDGTQISSARPKRLSLSHVVQVAAGANHACALHDDGSVSCWGDNSMEELGLGASAPMGNQQMPVKLSLVAGATAIAAGGRHTCVRLKDGSLSCWGRNHVGQLGDGTTVMRGSPAPVMSAQNDAQMVVTGDSHSCALRMDGSVDCWGAIRVGALAPGFDMQQLLPARVRQVMLATQVAAGDAHTCALVGGEVWCWGANDLGQAGDRMLGRLVAPTRVVQASGATSLDAGGNHSCALLGDGSIRCWGAGNFGELGGMVIDSGGFTTMAPATGTSWKSIATGARHNCALTADGAVFCWGRTTEGQLGDGTVLQFLKPEQPVGTIKDFVSVAAGSDHTCGLTKAGSVHCWGRGDFGQLGNGTTTGSTVPVPVELTGSVVQLVAGSQFNCVRMADGYAQCWGRANRGQIGDGATGDHLKPAFVVLPEKAIHLAAGAEHACAVGMSGSVYCWGETANGRLGNPAAPPSPQPKPVTVLMGGDFIQVGAGTNHTCALARTKQVTCWGLSSFGQVGVTPAAAPVGPTVVAGLSDATALALGAEHSCAIKSDGTIWCWGRGDSGQLGFGTTPGGSGLAQPVAIPKFGPATLLSAAVNHTCAVVAGVAYCWGANRFGQLGAGNTSNSSKPVAVMKLAAVASLDVGDRHTCAVTGGKAFCFGNNQFGQLGNGTPLERTSPHVVELDCP